MQLEQTGAQPLRADALPQPAVSVVIPVFNESASIPRLHARLHQVLQQLGRSFEIVYVDDGSTDRSLEELLLVQGWDPAVKVVTLARNAGQHAAVLAGFAHARPRGLAGAAANGDLDPARGPRGGALALLAAPLHAARLRPHDRLLARPDPARVACGYRGGAARYRLWRLSPGPAAGPRPGE